MRDELGEIVGRLVDAEDGRYSPAAEITPPARGAVTFAKVPRWEREGVSRIASA